jgi:CubicO group peptidase (beta-lactamase class C family)
MKFIKWFFIVLLSILIIGELLILVSGKRYLNNVFMNTIFRGKLGPDIDELELFEKNAVDVSKPQPWPLSVNYNKPRLSDESMQKIEGYQTVSFLVIKDDSLLYEKHWEGYSDTSYVNSFSMAKSITSMLIGCAIRDGLIESVDDPVGKYLDEYKEGERSKILIRHLLTMSSGIDFKEDYVSPLAWPAEAYYGYDVNALTLKAQCIMPCGKIWYYKGGDTQLLGMILKKVTGKPLSEYAAIKIWKPVGAERPAYWSIDSKGMEKVSCCWYTNAKDYARLAKLMMNYGNWNGVQLFDSTYAAQSITPAVLMDENGKETHNYGFQWWLMKYKEHNIFYARGIRGQYIFAIPDQRMIVVRLGHKRDKKKSAEDLPLDIYVYLDAALNMQ